MTNDAIDERVITELRKWERNQNNWVRSTVLPELVDLTADEVRASIKRLSALGLVETKRNSGRIWYRSIP